MRRERFETVLCKVRCFMQSNRLTGTTSNPRRHVPSGICHPICTVTHFAMTTLFSAENYLTHRLQFDTIEEAGVYMHYRENLNPDKCWVNAIHDDMQTRKGRIVNSDTTRFVTYRLVNPKLFGHPLYTKWVYSHEHHRITFTRIRLASHKLKVKTGRWSRIPRIYASVTNATVSKSKLTSMFCPIVHGNR